MSDVVHGPLEYAKKADILKLPFVPNRQEVIKILDVKAQLSYSHN